MPPDTASARGPDRSFVERRTERLIIRRLRSDDVESFARYRADPAVARFQGWGATFSREQAHEFITSLEATDPDTPGEWFQFALVEASSGRHIGDVAAGVDAADPRLATIGVTLAASAQREGYATEALTWLLDYLLLERGKHRVRADLDVRNDRIVRLLERLGMRREAHHLQHAWWQDEWVDEYGYALLAAEWATIRSRT